MSNPFGAGVRPWTRITNTLRAAATTVLAAGELAVTETGKVFAGNGTTPLSGLSPFLTEAAAVAQYVTWDGTNLRIGGVIIPITGGGPAVTHVDNNDGYYTITGAGVTDTGDGYLTLTDSTVTDNGDGFLTLAA